MKPKPKILLIDDEVAFSRLLARTLREYEVRIENTGSAALTTVHDFQPDLILLDLVMPDADGVDLAAQINNGGRTPRIPIIFISALIEFRESNEGHVTHHGYPAFGKPLKLEDVKRVIAKSLGR